MASQPESMNTDDEPPVRTESPQMSKSAVQTTSFFANPPTYEETFQDQNPIRIEATMQEDEADVHDIVQVAKVKDGMASSGYPDLSTIRRTGPSQAITLLLGLPSVEGFQRGTLGDWTTDHVDYEILPAAYRPDFDQKVTSSTPSKDLRASTSSNAGNSNRPRSSSSLSVSGAQSSQPLAEPKASAQDFALSRPHPNAFFSPQSHAWSVATPWPADQLTCSDSMRALKGKCPASDSEILFDGQEESDAGLTHRFVCLQKQVDPKYVLRNGSLKYNQSSGQPTAEEWTSSTSEYGDIPNGQFSSDATPTPRSSHWPLYVCNNTDSAHQLAVTTSPEAFVEMVCGSQLARDFEQAKFDNPPLNASIGNAQPTHADVMFAAWELLWRIIDNVLMKGEIRSLPITAKMFNSRIGWDDATAKLMAKLGFKLTEGNNLSMPKLDESANGAMAKLTLTRGWIETGLMALYWRERTTSACSKSVSRLARCMQLVSPRPKLDAMLGGNHIPVCTNRKSSWSTVGNKSASDAYQAYVDLGCTCVDPDAVLVHAYQRQVAGDPKLQPKYLSALERIADDTGSSELQMEVVKARSLGCWTVEDELKAYHTIGIDCTTDTEAYDEDLISATFQSKLEGCRDPPERECLRDALKLIANARSSDLLQTLYSSTAEIPRQPMSLEKAYTVFDGSSAVSDDLIMGMYTVYCDDAPGRKAEFEEALNVIAEHRNSRALRHFLKTGETYDPLQLWQAPVAAKPSNNCPVGLQNIGNTCYLNSLLQYLFTIKALRDVILKWETLVEEFPDTVNKRVGGRIVTAAEIRRSRTFVVLLAQLFDQLIHTPTSFIEPDKKLAYHALVTSDDEALENRPSETPVEASTSKALNSPEEESSAGPIQPPSVLPTKRTSAHSDPVSRKSPKMDTGRNRQDEESDYVLVDKDDSKHTEEPMPMLIDTAVDTDEQDHTARDGSQSNGKDQENTDAPDKHIPPPLPPRKRHSSVRGTSSIQIGTDMMFGKQHDVGECMDNVIFQVDAALSQPRLQECFGHSSIVQNLFYGKTRQILAYEKPGVADSVKEEIFSSIMVDVGSEGQDLYDGLDATFDDAVLETEVSPARRTLEMIEAPPMLQIMLQRVQFEKATSRSYKSNAYMAFPACLSMDRYMHASSSDAVTAEKRAKTRQLRSRLQACRKQLAVLTGPSMAEMPGKMRMLQSLATSVTDVPEGLDILFEGLLEDEADYLESQCASLKQEMVAIRDELQEIWKGADQYRYELSSVFMHRGEASYGHYWLHQRALPREPDRWLKFNDSIVTNISEAEVFENTTGKNHNPYLLTYVRKSKVDLVDAIARDIQS